MQFVRSLEQDGQTLVGWSVRTMLLSADTSGVFTNRLKNFGCIVEQEQELFIALDSILSDPSGYGLFVIDADSLGGLDAARQAIRLLADISGRLPMILVSDQCREQVFPQTRDKPTILRSPLSAVALRVGIEHALRHRTKVFA